jgi:hypothetical protein
MAKVKKFANGGALADVVGAASKFTAPPNDNSSAPSAAPPFGYGGSGVPDGAAAVSQGQDRTEQDINAASTGIQAAPRYKKGGHITTRRLSSVTKSSKSPTW